jgi:predicted nucleic acid-binding protein
MLVVLDTNVIISALLSPGGPPAEIVRRWEGDQPVSFLTLLKIDKS